LTVRVDDGVVVLTVTGNPDPRGAAALRAELFGLCAVCVGELTVDLLACNEISTAVLAVLEIANARAEAGRYRLTVRCRHPEIVPVLVRSGISVLGAAEQPASA
jgi:hypothetical protein